MDATRDHLVKQNNPDIERQLWYFLLSADPKTLSRHIKPSLCMCLCLSLCLFLSLSVSLFLPVSLFLSLSPRHRHTHTHTQECCTEAEGRLCRKYKAGSNGDKRWRSRGKEQEWGAWSDKRRTYRNCLYEAHTICIMILCQFQSRKCSLPWQFWDAN